MLSGTVSQLAHHAVVTFVAHNDVTKSAVMDDAIRYRFGLGPGPDGWRTPEPEEIVRLRNAAAKRHDAPNENDPSSAVVDAEGDPLRVSLQRARRIAPELASATDAVNVALDRVEQALTSLNLGVSASVDLYPGCTWDAGDWRETLRFGMEGSVWRLLIEGSTVGSDDDSTQSPLVTASRGRHRQSACRLRVASGMLGP
jgi:hypothetical protein